MRYETITLDSLDIEGEIMGEIIRVVGNINIKGENFNVELNAPISETGGVIHIQNEKMRLEMSQRDFYKIVGSINLAKHNLLKMKGLIDE